MQRIMLKSKIHGAKLTGTELHYEGSLAIDRRLMEAADLLPDEQIHVLNLSTGNRLITYVIEAPAGSGTLMLNGPSARLGMPGDTILVLSYCLRSEAEAAEHRAKIIKVDEHNQPL